MSRIRQKRKKIAMDTRKSKKRMSDMGYEVILLAAGQGKRMKASRNKVLIHLNGKPIILYSLELFLKDDFCKHIILVVQEANKHEIDEMLKPYIKKAHKLITVVVGGQERQDSVYQGLLSMKDVSDFVLIHDGARPFLTIDVLKQLYSNLQTSKAAVLGVPVKDTVKKVKDHFIEETIPRESLWQIQTPQAFIGSELLDVHNRAIIEGFLGTDDSSLIEKYQIRNVSIVFGSYENIKLTTPDDIIIGEAIIKRRIN